MVENRRIKTKLTEHETREMKQITIAPDFVIESEGLACGDKLILTLAIDQGNYYFSFYGNCCSVCEKTASILQKELYGKQQQHILAYTKMILDGVSIPNADIKFFLLKQPLCVRTAVVLLQQGVKASSESCEIDASSNLLACDACISSFSIQWNQSGKTAQKEKPVLSFEQLKQEASLLDDEEEMYLQKLAKCELSLKEVEELQQVMQQLNSITVKKIKKLRLPNLYCNNLVKYGQEVPENEVMYLTQKQIVSKLISQQTVQQIEAYIVEQGWQIAKVKGARTTEFYDQAYYRTFLDYDFVASDIQDGMQFIHYLLNEQGFKFVTGGSVPFSIKVVDDFDGQETLTGHLHLEKIIQDQFQVVIDINFGGFPLGRLGVVKIENKQRVSVEEQLLITLCHVFKHEKVYMKDINDIYFMLKNGNVCFDKLEELILQNQLELQYFILMNYMNAHFSLPKVNIEQYATARNVFVKEQYAQNWPYARSAQFWVKFYDNVYRLSKSLGDDVAFQKALAISSDAQKGYHSEATMQYRAVCPLKNERVYLYPAVLFNCFISFFKPQSQLEAVIDDCLWKFKGTYCELIVAPFGIFILYDQEMNFKRQEIEHDVRQILEAFNISKNQLNAGYVMNARQDLWLY